MFSKNIGFSFLLMSSLVLSPSVFANNSIETCDFESLPSSSSLHYGMSLLASLTLFGSSLFAIVWTFQNKEPSCEIEDLSLSPVCLNATQLGSPFIDPSTELETYDYNGTYYACHHKLKTCCQSENFTLMCEMSAYPNGDIKVVNSQLELSWITGPAVLTSVFSFLGFVGASILYVNTRDAAKIQNF